MEDTMTNNIAPEDSYLSFTEAWLSRYEDVANSRPYVPVPFEYYMDMQYLSNEDFGKLIRILLRFAISGEILSVEGDLRHYITRVIERQKRFQYDWNKLTAKRSAAGRKSAATRSKKKKSPKEEHTEVV